jgi:hypothetical protein
MMFPFVDLKGAVPAKRTPGSLRRKTLTYKNWNGAGRSMERFPLLTT